MSPLKACAKHGRAHCGLCAREARNRRRAGARTYSNTARYRQMLVDVAEAYGVDCHYCGQETTDDDRVLAHWPVAHADGGQFVLENLRPAHASCNKSAGRA